MLLGLMVYVMTVSLLLAPAVWGLWPGGRGWQVHRLRLAIEIDCEHRVLHRSCPDPCGPAQVMLPCPTCSSGRLERTEDNP